MPCSNRQGILINITYNIVGANIFAPFTLILMKKKKTWTIVIAIATLSIIIIAMGIYVGHLIVGHHFTNDKTAYVYIDIDDNIDSIRTKTIEAGNLKEILGFDIIADHYDLGRNIHTGRYEVNNSMRMLDYVRNLRSGNQKPLMMVVPSVRTIEDLCGRVTRNLMLDSADLASAFCDTSYCHSLGYKKETLPSLFIPNTYEVYWDMSVDEFAQRMLKENKKFWDEERIRKADELGMSKEEVATLASIVDSETANNGEKSRVAGLYINRLKKSILLQSDPTVIFAAQDFTIRRVLNKHLEIDSPYNTYKYPGLPPGPIRIPSIAGIDAVLNYENHNYIYMCAKEDFSGTHNFAVTYGEHLRNARRYINALNERGIKK